MGSTEFITGLQTFLDASPTPFHATSNLADRLTDVGFTRINESDAWQLKAGDGYFLVRNGSSILAWRQVDDFSGGFRMVGAHTDSPCLKVKPAPELQSKGYLQLGVEVYGGVLLNPWFDRDLSLAGRVTFLDSSDHMQSELIDFKEPIASIPSLAIHLDREVNQGRSINAQLHLPVVLGHAEEKLVFRDLLKTKMAAWGIDVSEVLDYELCFYDTQGAALIGLEKQFIASARLDNLLSCYIGLDALINSAPGQAQMLLCTDHEEVGSQSACGAQGPMLAQWLERLLSDPETRNRALARSMLISVDNAHAVHPNYADKHDDNHGPVLNKGPVIKLNANQRYATNSETSGRFKAFAKQARVSVQAFIVRSDMACGSTIGPITAAEVGVKTVDIGVPQFAMHSIRELAGVADAVNLSKILQAFYEAKEV